MNEEENLYEETTKKDEKNNLDDAKKILELVKEADAFYTQMKTIFEDRILNEYGLNPNVLEDILPFKKEEIDTTMDINDIRLFLCKHAKDQEIILKYKETDESDLRMTMGHIKDISLQLISSKLDLDDIKSNSSDVIKDYFNYMSSEKVRDINTNRLKIMKESLNEITDEVEKKSVQGMIDTLESSLTYSFLYKRFDRYGDEELDSIRTSFYDKRRGQYIIDKYIAKNSRFGFKPDLWHYLFNIEENFLPEKYHVYNNLFLFIYMRFVAYADPYNKKDKMYVHSLTGAISNLIYHRFESTNSEKEFILFIQTILDKFDKYYDDFEQNNTLHPNHPERIRVEKEHDKKRKEIIIEKMKTLKINDYDSDWDVKTLQNHLNQKIDEMEKEQTTDSSKVIVSEDNDDNTVSIEPNMKNQDKDILKEIKKKVETDVSQYKYDSNHDVSEETTDTVEDQELTNE